MEGAPRIRSSELDALLKVSTALTSSLELGEVLQAAIDGAIDVLDLDTGAIYLLEQDELVLGATTPPLPPRFPQHYSRALLSDHPHAQRSLESGDTVFVRDLASEQITEAERGVCETRGLRSVFFVPLISEAGPIGVFIVGTTENVRDITPADQDLCRTLSHQVTLAVTNAHLYESVLTALSQFEAAQTTLLETNRALVDTNMELRKAKEVRDKFLALMSHELRTPLTVIISYLAFILDRGFGDPSEDLKGILSIMREQGKVQLGLIDDLLDLSRLEAGHFKLMREPDEVGNLVDKVVEAFRPLRDEKEIQMRVDTASDLPTVHWDRKRMTQVFQNLVGNALKFTAPGGMVTVSACAKAGFLELRVSDTGIGIPEESRKQIFDSFYQVDSSSTRKYGGSGLGLAFVKEIVRAHGGRVFVKSHEGAGSSFIVLLPLDKITEVS